MLRLVRDTDGVPPWSVADRLMAAHDHWLPYLRRLAKGALASDAPAADRDAAIREFSERFAKWYERECHLVRTLASLLQTEDAGRLHRVQQAVDDLRNELRSQSQSPSSAAAVREAILDLLDAVQLWCAEFELATVAFPMDRLNEEGRAILTRLD